MTNETLEELMALLKECDVEDYELNTKDKKLTILYKEDFDKFFPRLNAKPMVQGDPKEYGAMYGAGHYAFFSYKDYEIYGNIVHHKPDPK